MDLFGDDVLKTILAESNKHQEEVQAAKDAEIKAAKATGKTVPTVVPIEDLLHIYCEFLDTMYLGGANATVPWLVKLKGACSSIVGLHTPATLLCTSAHVRQKPALGCVRFLTVRATLVPLPRRSGSQCVRHPVQQARGRPADGDAQDRQGVTGSSHGYAPSGWNAKNMGTSYLCFVGSTMFAPSRAQVRSINQSPPATTLTVPRRPSTGASASSTDTRAMLELVMGKITSGFNMYLACDAEVRSSVDRAFLPARPP